LKLKGKARAKSTSLIKADGGGGDVGKKLKKKKMTDSVAR
jgi:hypothetical protein